MHITRLPHSPRKLQRAFSLVELLAVVGTISVLLGLTVPAMNGLNGSSSLNTGVRNVANLMNLARSEAIAQHTVIRFAVVTDWNGNQEASLRKASLWKWDEEVEQFTQLTPWQELPVGLSFERDLPDYIKSANYAVNDGSSVRGESILSAEAENPPEFKIGEGEGAITARFVEFLPSGSARIPGTNTRKAIFVTVPGHLTEHGDFVYTAISGSQPARWAQVNLDTLTGRVQVLLP